MRRMLLSVLIVVAAIPGFRVADLQAASVRSALAAPGGPTDVWFWPEATELKALMSVKTTIGAQP